MVQWMNLLRNSRFDIDCEKKTGALGLAQPGLTAGRLAVRQSGSPSDEIILALEIFKIYQRANLEALGLFERRYSILSSIFSIVVGFLCSDFYNVDYF